MKVTLTAVSQKTNTGKSHIVEKQQLYIGNTTVPTNLDPLELPETKPPTKEHTWAGPGPPAHDAAEDCLDPPQWKRTSHIL